MNPGDPTDFEKDLAELEHQYRAMDQDQPPELLDQAILNKARLAVEPHSTRPWSFGWMHLAATAGVLVLGLTLVLQQRGEVPQISAPGEAMPMPAADDSMIQAEIGARKSSREQPDNEELRIHEQQMGPRPAASPQEQDMIGELRKEANSPIADQDGFEQSGADRAARLQPESPESGAPVNGISAYEVSAPEIIVTGATMSDTVMTEPEGAKAKDESFRDASSDSDDQSREAAELTAPANALPPTPQGSEEEPAAAFKSMTAGFAETSPPPDEWIAAILQLKLEGPEGAWREELDAFVAIYPDYPLPEELSETPGEAANEE